MADPGKGARPEVVQQVLSGLAAAGNSLGFVGVIGALKANGLSADQILECFVATLKMSDAQASQTQALAVFLQHLTNFYAATANLMQATGATYEQLERVLEEVAKLQSSAVPAPAPEIKPATNSVH